MQREGGRAIVLRGDAAHLPLPDGSVDAIVTDPPYGLAELPAPVVTKAIAAWLAGDREHVPDGRGFMGREWDQFVPPPAVWDECLRVLKPGGHLLAFAGSRTADLMGLSVRLAGFEIRDSIKWVFGQGFPKSLDVSKAIDKLARRDYVLAAMELGLKIPGNNLHDWTKAEHSPGDEWWERFKAHLSPEQWGAVERAVVARNASGKWHAIGAIGIKGGVYDITTAATEDGARWEGWGTALKPAHEPIIVARKPLAGTVAANILEHGTGALNIDGCRVAVTDPDYARNAPGDRGQRGQNRAMEFRMTAGHASDAGRWPPNVLLSEEAAAEMDRQSGVRTSGGRQWSAGDADTASWRRMEGREGPAQRSDYAREADSGGASRFFPVFRYEAKADASERPRLPDGTAWPTVKPVALMRWLVRLVTPPGGIVLDPFCGTGTTGEAAVVEGFRAILADRDPQALALARVRLARPVQPTLFGLEAS